MHAKYIGTPEAQDEAREKLLARPIGNNAAGLASAIGGGYVSTTSADYATVPGRRQNVASGTNSFAAGHQAQALHPGAFVWADSQAAVFASLTNDQFSVRARGGVRLVTSGAGLTVVGQPALVNGQGITIQTNDSVSFVTEGTSLTVDGEPVLTLSNRLRLIIQDNDNGSPNIIMGYYSNYVAKSVIVASISGGDALAAANAATASYATIGGGDANVSAGPGATVAGGENNTASGNDSTVAGGFDNVASGVGSFAAGQHAQTSFEGSFL